MVLVYFPQKSNLSLGANSNSTPQGISGDVVAAVKLLQVLEDTPALIADATFDHYKFYTIDTGQVPVSQTNIALVIIDTLPPSTFVGISGFDIRVFDSNNVAIPYELELADINPDGSGDVIIWLNMPVVDVGEFVQVTFGKAGATDGQNPGGVYDINHKAVYHLDGVGTDSTSNAQNGTIFGTTTVAGKIGNALDFPGTVNDFLIRNPFTGFPTTALTISFWINTTGTSDAQVSYAVTGSVREFLTLDQNGFLVFVDGLITFIFNQFNDGAFHLITVTWRSSDGQLIVYDGTTVQATTTQAMGASLTAGGSMVLAQDQGTVGGGFAGIRALDGILDNVIIEDVVRDSDYITARFNNQNDNNAFWSESVLFDNPIILVDNFGEPIEVVEPVI